MAVRHAPAAGVRKPPEDETAMGVDGGGAGTMGIWPRRRKRWGVGEAIDGKDGWLADALSAGFCGFEVFARIKR